MPTKIMVLTETNPQPAVSCAPPSEHQNQHEQQDTSTSIIGTSCHTLERSSFISTPDESFASFDANNDTMTLLAEHDGAAAAGCACGMPSVFGAPDAPSSSSGNLEATAATYRPDTLDRMVDTVDALVLPELFHGAEGSFAECDEKDLTIADGNDISNDNSNDTNNDNNNDSTLDDDSNFDADIVQNESSILSEHSTLDDDADVDADTTQNESSIFAEHDDDVNTTGASSMARAFANNAPTAPSHLTKIVGASNVPCDESDDDNPDIVAQIHRLKIQIKSLEESAKEAAIDTSKHKLGSDRSNGSDNTANFSPTASICEVKDRTAGGPNSDAEPSVQGYISSGIVQEEAGALKDRGVNQKETDSTESSLYVPEESVYEKESSSPSENDHLEYLGLILVEDRDSSTTSEDKPKSLSSMKHTATDQPSQRSSRIREKVLKLKATRTCSKYNGSHSRAAASKSDAPPSTPTRSTAKIAGDLAPDEIISPDKTADVTDDASVGLESPVAKVSLY